MIKYSIAMGIRMICIVALLFVHGWWLLVAAIGAIVLPYFAVVIANVGSSPPQGDSTVIPRAGVLAQYRGDGPPPPGPAR